MTCGDIMGYIMMFDREQGKLPPLLYKIGDRIMGYHQNMGGGYLVGGEIIECEQSKSYIDCGNKYKVKLEGELLVLGSEDGELYWWLTEKEAQPFDDEIWKKAVEHWIEYGRLHKKAYLEHIKMHRALQRKEEISDEDLESLLKERGRL